MHSPIFIEYYSHEGCDCYKILNPYTKYREEKIVLGRVDEGLEKAKAGAVKAISLAFAIALENPIKEA